MSTDYYAYKQTLLFSSILEIQDYVEGFTVVVPENPNDSCYIQYESNVLHVYLNDDRKTVSSMTRYGSNKVGKILHIISHFAEVDLYNEYDVQDIEKQECADTILIVHFTESEKSLGLNFAKSLKKTPKCIDGAPFNGDLKKMLKELSGYHVPNLWFENLNKMGGKEAFLQEVHNSWENYEFELFIYNGDEEIKIPIMIPVERVKFVFTPSEENLNIYFDEQLQELNGNLFDHKYSDEMDRDNLKLSIEACRAIVEGCENGKKWVNDQYLENLAKDDETKEPNCFALEASFLWQYEEFVVEGCQDGINEFREKNPGMKTFCDFFESRLLQFYNVTAESDQLTSS
jgi:hypothetical protein